MEVAEQYDETLQGADGPALTTAQKRVLAVFSAIGHVTRACRSAGVSRETHYRWLRESESYKAGFEESQGHVARMLEDEAIRRAVQGETKPVRYKGKVVGWETTRADGLLQFLRSRASASRCNRG